MALTITKQTIIDGPRNLVVKVHLLGDSNDATATLLINVSDYSNPTPGVGASVKVMRIVSTLENFHCTLLWDADTDVSFADIPAGVDAGDRRVAGPDRFHGVIISIGERQVEGIVGKQDGGVFGHGSTLSVSKASVAPMGLE